MSPLERFSKWIQLKIYQVEVAFSVYIFTPMEKFAFYTVLFLLFSLTAIATVLYLPQHVTFVISRVWFYVHGESVDAVPALAKDAAPTLAATAAAAAGAATTAAAKIVREL